MAHDRWLRSYAPPGPSLSPLMSAFYRVLPGIVKLFWEPYCRGRECRLQPLICTKGYGGVARRKGWSKATA